MGQKQCYHFFCHLCVCVCVWKESGKEKIKLHLKVFNNSIVFGSCISLFLVSQCVYHLFYRLISLFFIFLAKKKKQLYIITLPTLNQ